MEVLDAGVDRGENEFVHLLDVRAKAHPQAQPVDSLIGDGRRVLIDDVQRTGGGDDPHHVARVELGRYLHVHGPRIRDRTSARSTDSTRAGQSRGHGRILCPIDENLRSPFVRSSDAALLQSNQNSAEVHV